VAFVKEGYETNAVVFRCVDLIASNMGSVGLQVMLGDKEAVPTHPLHRLLERPNPMQTWAEFAYELMAWRLLAGNGWCEGVVFGADQNNTQAEVGELWCKKHPECKVLANETDIIPGGYEWRQESSGRLRAWKLDPMTGRANMMHWRGFSGTERWYGMSPLEAGARSVDQDNMINEWNMKLMQQGAVPPGVLKSDKILTPQQKEKLKADWEANYAGARNAGHTPVLEGGLSYEKIGMSPTELDWLGSKKMTTQGIAAVFGVPLQCIPLDGSQTFANYEQARLALWEDTVLPWLDRLCGAVNNWLAPRYGDDVRIIYDADTIPALEVRRAARSAALQNANYITTNEKRGENGFPALAIPQADQILIPAGMIPLDYEEPLPSESAGKPAGE
jgi:phage portal protein BeeE